jgi:hypothetical protein
MSTPDRIITSRELRPHFKTLRGHFDRVFADPKNPSPERFCWDPWFVPGEYSLLRTPAMRFFPKPIMDRFLKDLAGFGQSQLGCIGLTPPWLSLYLEGNEQKLHVDLPHGPWAYVYSLSPARPLFQGGETMLLNTKREGLFDLIAPVAGQLTVFDPKIPHGVSRVSGVSDARAGRLVVHGWFTDPAPFVQGPLKAERVLTDLLTQISARLLKDQDPVGLLVFEFEVSPSGEVIKARLKRDTIGLKPTLYKELIQGVRLTRFPRAPRKSHVTLPIWLTKH